MSGAEFFSNVPITQGNQVYLRRPRIERRIEEALKSQIVMISAGAGYGKTQAVYSTLQKQASVQKYRVKIIWTQLSERDNIAERFWENFIASIAIINAKTAEKLKQFSFPYSEARFKRYIQVPVEDIEPSTPYIFVYDDFHHIDNPAVLQFMERSANFVYKNQPNISSIFISRTEIGIHGPELFSRGAASRIGEDELRFTEEEVAAYLAMQNIHASVGTVKAVYQDTEGWAFAIHLAGLSLRNSQTSGYVPSAMRSNIFRLIESEIMEGISPELRKFLVKLSLVDHLSPALLEKIGNSRVIDEMKKLGSFIQFESYLGEYRIHHLFLEYLSMLRNELSEDEIRELYKIAAAYFASVKRTLEAIHYYEKAGDYTGLIDLVYISYPLAIPKGIALILLDIFDRAPGCVYSENAVSYVFLTRLLMSLNLFERAEEELKNIIAMLETRELSPANCRTLGGCCNNLGILRLATNTEIESSDFLPWFERAHYYYNFHPYKIKPPISVWTVSPYICNVSKTEQGEMERFIQAVTEITSHTRITCGGLFSGMDDLGRGELAFFRGKLDEAEAHIGKALSVAREYDQWEIENRALFYLLRIFLYRKRTKAIPSLLRQLEAQLKAEFYLNRYIYHDIVMAWYYIHTGNPNNIADWLKNDYEESELGEWSFGLEILLRAKYFLVKKQYLKALACFRSRNDRRGLKNYVMGRIESLILESTCLARLQNTEEAEALLEQARSQAAPNAFIMPFLEAGLEPKI
ncbi:MAG: helix-turn-helix transcriptional regulator [Treponema sp.]|nr:helix-turn-helix transcriptional regulator [Treponema sp.]